MAYAHQKWNWCRMWSGPWSGVTSPRCSKERESNSSCNMKANAINARQLLQFIGLPPQMTVITCTGSSKVVSLGQHPNDKLCEQHFSTLKNGGHLMIRHNTIPMLQRQLCVTHCSVVEPPIKSMTPTVRWPGCSSSCQSWQ